MRALCAYSGQTLAGTGDPKSGRDAIKDIIICSEARKECCQRKWNVFQPFVEMYAAKAYMDI